MRHTFLAAAVCALAACNASRETYQLERVPETGGVPGIAVDAKQRLVWTPERPVRFLEQETANQYSYKIAPHKIVCAEPSPDAVSAFAASLNTSLGVALEKVEVDASLARSLVESVQQLTQRTEIMQLLRDGYYRACEAYANGMMGEFGYALVVNELDDLILKAVALNAIAQQRPLPETEAERQKLSAEKMAEIELNGAHERLQAARAEVGNKDASLSAAKSQDHAAQVRKAAADAQVNQLTEALAATETKEEEKPKLREQLRIAKAKVAEETQSMTLSAGRLREATDERAAAQKAVTDLETQVKTLETALGTAKKAAAAIVQPPFAPEALKTIENILMQSSAQSTIGGACLIWLAQHLNIRPTATQDEPALAAFCRNFLMRMPGKQASKPEVLALVHGVPEAEEEMARQMLNAVRRQMKPMS